MIENAYAVIMAGGKGERFWPLSTSRMPKQLLNVFGETSLLAEAIERLDDLVPPERILIITSQEFAEATRKAAPSLPPQNVIGEPMGRDTAAACACALALVKQQAPDGAFAVLTADHIIRNNNLFQQTLAEGMQLALASDVLITIGIEPTFPSTGFGYIEAGDEVSSGGEITFQKALRFVEKPDLPAAESYITAGNYFWNSGMFVWSVKALEAGFKTHRPVLYELVQRLQDAGTGATFENALGREYPDLEKISIDYALMEKADNIVMARGVFEWHDVGAWDALASHFPADESGNVIRGQCAQIDSEGNIVVSNDRLTALVGVKDLVVIHADKATLICPRDKAQEVKRIVNLLNERGGYQDLL